MSIATAALAVALATAGTAYAASDAAPGRIATQGTWMTVDQVKAKLAAEGYQVRSIKAEKGSYEMKGFDPKGKRIETEIDPVSGTVLGKDSDD